MPSLACMSIHWMPAFEMNHLPVSCSSCCQMFHLAMHDKCSRSICGSTQALHTILVSTPCCQPREYRLTGMGRHGGEPGVLCKVETEGDTIMCCAVSSSGEVMAFGGNGGYAHIWAGRRDAHVNAMSQPLPPPAPRAPPRATLAEHDSFARAPQYPMLEVCRLQPRGSCALHSVDPGVQNKWPPHVAALRNPNVV